jgi:hypothetical protein
MTEFEGTEFGIVQRVARFGAKAICLEALLSGPSKLMGDRRDDLGPGHQSRRKASSKFNLFNVRIPTLTGRCKMGPAGERCAQDEGLDTWRMGRRTVFEITMILGAAEMRELH